MLTEPTWKRLYGDAKDKAEAAIDTGTVEDLQKRNAELDAALYDATEGISATLLHDENEWIKQQAADALALVDWWFSPEPYCPRCAKADSLGHSVLVGKRDEMIDAVREALATLKKTGIVPADPNPF